MSLLYACGCCMSVFTGPRHMKSGGTYFIYTRTQGLIKGGQMPPKDFSCPPKHMTPSTIPLLPCQMCTPKFLQLLILPPQGRMSRLNPAYLSTWMWKTSYIYRADLNNVPRTMPPTAGFTPEGSLNKHPLTATVYTYMHACIH